MATAPQISPGDGGNQDARFRPSFFATKPTGWTLFLRTFLPWQMVRFGWINMRMIVLIFRSHH